MPYRGNESASRTRLKVTEDKNTLFGKKILLTVFLKEPLHNLHVVQNSGVLKGDLKSELLSLFLIN